MDRRISMDDFEIIRVIGRGYMGKVLVVRHRQSGDILAVKSIHKRAILERREISHTRAERDILAELVVQQKTHPDAHCPFLVRLHAAFQDSANIYYLMDFHGGGDLAGLLCQLVRLPENWARMYAAEIATGIISLHKRNIVYRDLKPENVLISREGHLVLTDFGLSKLLPAGIQTRTFCGTPEYLAPEVLLRCSYGREVDWWSFGALLYELLVGTTPFWSENASQMYALIISDKMPEYPLSVSKTARDLINRLVVRNPKKRLGDEEVRAHPFFAGIDWDKLERLQYPAPYVPGLNSNLDVDAFDPLFTALPPVITPESSFYHQDADSAFQGFTFRGA